MIQSFLLSPMPWFALSIILLDAYDITLPRGDSLSVSGSLVAAAVLVVGPLPALFTGVVSIVAVRMWRSKGTAIIDAVSEGFVRAAAVCVAVVVDVLLSIGSLDSGWLRLLLVPVALLVCEFLLHQLLAARRFGRPLKQMLIGNLQRQGLMIAAEGCVAALAAVLYDSMRLWTLLPVTALLMLIRQAYAMLLEIRETYHQTLQVLIDAAESNEPGRVGHSERVAVIARSIGAACGLSTPELERVSYAALLHDVHGISDAPAPDAAGSGTAESVVKGVNFFSEVVPVLRVIAGAQDAPHASDKDLLEGFIVALASDIDAQQKPEVATAHGTSSVSVVGGMVPSRIKARAVAAAVAQGFPVPAID